MSRIAMNNGNTMTMGDVGNEDAHPLIVRQNRGASCLPIVEYILEHEWTRLLPIKQTQPNAGALQKKLADKRSKRALSFS